MGRYRIFDFPAVNIAAKPDDGNSVDKFSLIFNIAATGLIPKRVKISRDGYDRTIESVGMNDTGKRIYKVNFIGPCARVFCTGIDFEEGWHKLVETDPGSVFRLEKIV